MFKRRIKEQPQPTPKDISVPNGTVIRAKSLYFYVKGGKKYQIVGERILRSQGYSRIVELTASAANRIPNAVGKISFREGSVVQDISDRKVYLISDNKRCLITSPDVYSNLEIGQQNVIVASHEEILLHEGGEDIGRL